MYTYTDSYHFIHGFTKLPATLNGYCLPLDTKWLLLAMPFLAICSMVGLSLCSVNVYFVTYSISYSWGNKDSLTIASICWYTSRSVAIHYYCNYWSSLCKTVNHCLFVIYTCMKNIVLGVGSCIKYSTRLCVVLYLLLNPTPSIVFSMHYL